MSKNKKALLRSFLALVLCVSMLIGTTFAWFTDTVTNGQNTINAGNLKADVLHLDKENAKADEEGWVSLKENKEHTLFNYIYWEPGYVQYETIKIANKGNLAFQYRFLAKLENEITGANGERLADVIDVYIAEGVQAPEVRSDITDDTTGTWKLLDTLSNVMMKVDGLASGELLPESEAGKGTAEPVGESVYTIALHMQETAGNGYQNLSLGDFYLDLYATQYTYEEDSFGKDYDAGAFFPEINYPISIAADITGIVENGALTETVVITGPYGVRVTIPEGVRVEDGATKLTLSLVEKEESESNVTLGENEQLKAFDVHVEGIAEDNTVPMTIEMGEVLPVGLNKGNLQVYHIEDGNSEVMEEVPQIGDFTKHNQFTYEPETGATALYMATFSEVTTVADTENAWNGEFDYSWYTNVSTYATEGDTSDYVIANADQLAAFGAIVGGMNDQTQDSFARKTVKLISDVNLGDKEAKNNENLIFYPIGYHNSTGSYEKTSGGSVSSSVSSFEGTFDGSGHTISNFYQNTWEMFGDYNDGYSGTPNHYKDAMGLFGYVLNGTVKNLTVNNFSSDGEYTPTGAIAAYAANSTFENIAITNCNPRVYNTGNGGIIGIAGNNNDQGTQITLKNITVDNSNKISALWGSWDVACGGLIGMLRGNADGGNGKIHFENCHVSAQIDVYNDVCANYQYYAYRYAGMIIGSVRHNTTNTEGKTIPNMTGISASGCTVNYGDWNDYYYCEFEKNTMASYSEDYQFSRIPHSELKFTDSNGNGVVDKDERASVTGCKHTHTDEENHQAIYLPFHQLFTGYSWGVSSIGLEEYSGIVTNLDITEGDQQESVEKFAAKKIQEVENNKEYKVADFFEAKDDAAVVNSGVVVAIEKVNEAETVVGTFTKDSDDWKEGKIQFEGVGTVKITIQDYNFCTPTTLEVNVINRVKAQKFEVAFDHDTEQEGNQNYKDSYTYRVGNENTVALGSLFEAMDNVEINAEKVSVTISSINGNAGGTYTSNSDWTKGTIQFSGTGTVSVTIGDGDYCEPTVVELEVVNAKNATSAASAKSNSVVLLNNVNISTIEVSGGYTLYGNGFKVTAKNDVMYDALGVGFVTLKNGTLDNVQVICPNFSYAIVYNSQIKNTENTAKPTDSTNDARGNVRSAVMADGNSKIVNSYVHGGRAAIFLRSGNLIIDKSTISGGAAANIHAMSAQSITLRDVTLIQKPFQANVHDTSKTIMGFSGLFECDGSENAYATPLILEGTLIQKAWVNEEYTKYVPSTAQSIIDSALSKKDYLHDLNNDGVNESLNLGFAYIPQDSGGKTSTYYITDNRTNKNTVQYGSVDVESIVANAKVYSYKNTNGTSSDFSTEGIFTPSTQGTTAPVLSFKDVSSDRVFETKFDTSNNRWESTLTVDLDKGNYNFVFDNLLVQKQGYDLEYTVKTEDGTPVDKSTGILLESSSVTNYVLTVTDKNVTHTCYFILKATKTSIPDPEVVDTEGGTALLVVKSKGGDWSCAIPALDGIKIKYFTADGEITLDLATLTPVSTGKQNGTNSYWEYSNGYTLKVSCGVIHDTKQVYGMPVVVNNNGNKMYFTISSTNGYVSTGTSSRTVTLTYDFTDPNGKTLTFSKKWQFNYADYKNGTQYSYDDFVKGTLKEASSGGCVTPETLITLADGTKKEIQDLTGKEQLLVWNHETASFQSAPVAYIVNHDETNREYEVINLTFSDGSDIEIIGEHVFYDATLNKYVALDGNAADYIGHKFVKANDGYNSLEKVKLVKVEKEVRNTKAYEVVSYKNITCFTDDILSASAYLDGILNVFDINRFTLGYNLRSVQKDIEKYGLYTAEDFEGLVTEEVFEMYNAAYLKVAVGKGYITWDDILALIDIYFNVDVQPIK